MSNRPKAAMAKRATSPPPMLDLVLGYIHPGQVSAYFTQSLIGTLLYDRATTGHVVGILNEWSSANVSNARNKIVRAFLQDFDADWLLFVDADMAWEANAPHQLLAVADPLTAPIVGGLCFGSAEDRLFPTIYVMTETDGKPMTMRLTDYPPDTMFRVDATGAAYLLIHRTVLEAMGKRDFNDAFPWFQETHMSGQPVSEDITFCLRAGLLDYPVHVNTAVQIGHHKSHLLTADLFQAQREAECPATTSASA